jgi:ribosomal protein L32E
LVWQAIVGKDSKKSKNYFAHQWAKEKAVREFIPSGFSFFEISSANNQLWISIR